VSDILNVLYKGARLSRWLRVKVEGGKQPVIILAMLFVACAGLSACGASREAKLKSNDAHFPAKYSTVTYGQLKLRLPVSMAPSAGVLPVGSDNTAIRSQSGKRPGLRMGTLENFQDKMAQYVAKGFLSDSVTTFDGFFSELTNLVGTRNYPKLQNAMGVNFAKSAKKYPRDNPSLYRFDFAKEKHVYIVFSNPRYVAEIYFLKGAISDADMDAISSGIRN